jgi:hypothetical protein
MQMPRSNKRQKRKPNRSPPPAADDSAFNNHSNQNGDVGGLVIQMKLNLN